MKTYQKPETDLILVAVQQLMVQASPVEKGFNMDDMKADIPNDLKKHDAFSFARNTVALDAEKMADYLINELRERKRNGRR